MSRPPARPSERRARGATVEEHAAKWLEAQGFTILDRNHLTRRGELDIVAEDGEFVVFVEVRSRLSAEFGTPAETVGFGKRRRIISAAKDWAVRAGIWDKRPMRFDVLSVIDRGEGELEIEHLPNAFDASGQAT